MNGIYVRTDKTTGKSEVVVNGLKVYEFRDAKELHDLAMQLVLVLGYSLGSKSDNLGG
jgi:hypothetical protein